MQAVDRWAAYGPSDLPPSDAWLIDPEKEKLVTPTDDRGLILIDPLIVAVKATVDPTYTWPGETEIHHFYWEAHWYPHDPELPHEDDLAIFRNLAPHKGVMPKIFEAWLHRITIPAAIPNLEVRRNRVKSWGVARKLFLAAQESLTWEDRARMRRLDVANHPDRVDEEFGGKDIIGERYMREVLTRNFERFERHLRENEQVPEEFRMVTAEEPHAVITELSRFVSRRSVALNLTPVIKAAA